MSFSRVRLDGKGGSATEGSPAPAPVSPQIDGAHGNTRMLHCWLLLAELVHTPLPEVIFDIPRALV